MLWPLVLFEKLEGVVWHTVSTCILILFAMAYCTSVWQVHTDVHGRLGRTMLTSQPPPALDTVIVPSYFNALLILRHLISLNLFAAV
jgi:hypothetical protein